MSRPARSQPLTVREAVLLASRRPDHRWSRAAEPLHTVRAWQRGEGCTQDQWRDLQVMCGLKPSRALESAATQSVT
jgi:hypothetical protein